MHRHRHTGTKHKAHGSKQLILIGKFVGFVLPYVLCFYLQSIYTTEAQINKRKKKKKIVNAIMCDDAPSKEVRPGGISLSRRNPSTQ